jgi:hypothetical protein
MWFSVRVGVNLDWSEQELANNFQMEHITEVKCACGNCGEIIDYRAEMAGQVIECPKCKEKSRLPEPSPLKLVDPEAPPPVAPPRLCPACGANMVPYGATCEVCETKRRRTLGLIVGVVSAVVVLGVGWLFLKKFYTTAPAQRSAAPANLALAQPRVKTPKSMKDFKISSFGLESKRGSDLVVAVGDIQNVSANLYLHMKAEADLLDAKGVKIGTVSDEVKELLPDKTWRFLVTVKDPRARSVRFASLKEIP